MKHATIEAEDQTSSASAATRPGNFHDRQRIEGLLHRYPRGYNETSTIRQLPARGGC